jgi:DNA-binding HxlR family transcriptional regulator
MGGEKVRAGAHALSLLSVPLNVEVLLALKEEPRPLSVVRKAAGSPPPTTMRGHLRRLTELGILQRSRREEFPGTTDLTLGPAGTGLLPVISALKAWLAAAPDGQVELGTPAAKSSIKALIEGWSHSIIRAVAARPLSLTELDGLISSLTYPSLERRLAAMRDVGQLVSCQTSGRGTPYAATEWLRRGIGPLAAAALWERTQIPTDSAPIGRLDIEAAFLLAVPMLTLPPHVSGTCRLAVEIHNGRENEYAGVVIDVREGEILSCSSRLTGSTDAAVTGSTRAWLCAVSDREPGRLELAGGASGFAGDLIDCLHGIFVRVPQLS